MQLVSTRYLADMQLISKYKKIIQPVLCAINVRVFFYLKDERSITITNTFQNFLDKSNRKPNKIWVDKASEFYNRSMTSWLQDNDIRMYLTRNEGKFVVGERFIRILKIKSTNI